MTIATAMLPALTPAFWACVLAFAPCCPAMAQSDGMTGEHAKDRHEVAPCHGTSDEAETVECCMRQAAPVQVEGRSAERFQVAPAPAPSGLAFRPPTPDLASRSFGWGLAPLSLDRCKLFSSFLL